MRIHEFSPVHRLVLGVVLGFVIVGVFIVATATARVINDAAMAVTVGQASSSFSSR